ncbi:MAG: low molecular weight phosphotyrosine protein phosphatase [Proteobacteria bacterium]|uniref:protein-tyrosine-phosphatase n=1 Tax=Candidatus Avisuccinivibrio stercorigallinarum TaxID=2840704 RepID=A0A9D9GTY4_9GAMM|nr:low molecular weight phosphotyrosine protein phosphatase [Candidatus Avisuccinivibrio stercorigallinarum]
MLSILMLCHGNICRSPLAEYLLRDRIVKEDLPLSTASAAVSTEELGNPVYPPVRRILEKKGIDCSKKRARRITREDLENFDLLLAMDAQNLRLLTRMFGPLPGKVKLLLDFTERKGEEIADPWYTGGFTECLADIEEGLDGLINTLKKSHFKPLL